MTESSETSKDLARFLEDFNRRYPSRPKKEPISPEELEELKPSTPPKDAPCMWGYPCNHCGQC